MSLSVFDLFKIGIGPSSSHTSGPMTAAYMFTALLSKDVSAVRVRLYGSLGATGIGHGTDKAVILGLMGNEPASVRPELVNDAVTAVRTDRRLPSPRLTARSSSILTRPPTSSSSVAPSFPDTPMA